MDEDNDFPKHKQKKGFDVDFLYDTILYCVLHETMWKYLSVVL